MNWFQDNIKKAALKKAIICKGVTYTYKELESTIQEYYKILKSEISEGDVVAYISDYTFYSISLFLALVKNKNIIVPILQSFSLEERKDKIAIAQASFLIDIKDDGELSLTNFHLVKQQEDYQKIRESKSAGFVIFSSGSTGEPKAMVHDLDAIIDGFKDTKQYDNNMLIFLLSDHIGGLNTLLTALSSTSILTLVNTRNPEDIALLIQKHKVNILPVTPTFLNLLLISGVHKEYDLSSLKIITYGTEYMPESLLKRLKLEFPNVRFIQLFGTSETGIVSTQNDAKANNLLKINGPNISYKIENHVLFLKSKTQVIGYLNQVSDKFDEEGWFNTGDIVEETPDGFIKILSRKDSIINVGGEKVFPSEVENYLMNFPFILDCVVYGKTNPITGQSVVADIMLIDGFQKNEAKKEIRKFFYKNVASFKMPTKLYFIDDIEFSQRFKKIRKNKR